jgi:DNA modification methylase
MCNLPVNTILQGDWLGVLKTLPDESINCVVTSPPYWGLRDYGVNGQLGLEPSPYEYVSNLVDGFEEIRRVLRPDGTIWLNLGDCYCSTSPGTMPDVTHQDGTLEGTKRAKKVRRRLQPEGIKPKDLVGIPWRVAFAFQNYGWYLRSDIIWHKPNPMPESVRDRPTKSHEYLFLLSKSEKYYFDVKAYAEPCRESNADRPRMGQGEKTIYRQKRKTMPMPAGWATGKGKHTAVSHCRPDVWKKTGLTVPQKVATTETRNRRTVWTIPIQPYKGSHFATYPIRLIEPCILAGCPEGGIVFDPFMGAGTTAIAAVKHGRNYLGIELNPEYINLANQRIKRWINKHGTPLFMENMNA